MAYQSKSILPLIQGMAQFIESKSRRNLQLLDYKRKLDRETLSKELGSHFGDIISQSKDSTELARNYTEAYKTYMKEGIDPSGLSALVNAKNSELGDIKTKDFNRTIYEMMKDNFGESDYVVNGEVQKGKNLFKTLESSLGGDPELMVKGIEMINKTALTKTDYSVETDTNGNVLAFENKVAPNGTTIGSNRYIQKDGKYYTEDGRLAPGNVQTEIAKVTADYQDKQWTKRMSESRLSLGYERENRIAGDDFDVSKELVKTEETMKDYQTKSNNLLKGTKYDPASVFVSSEWWAKELKPFIKKSGYGTESYYYDVEGLKKVYQYVEHNLSKGNYKGKEQQVFQSAYDDYNAGFKPAYDTYNFVNDKYVQQVQTKGKMVNKINNTQTSKEPTEYKVGDTYDGGQIAEIFYENGKKKGRYRKGSSSSFFLPK